MVDLPVVRLDPELPLPAYARDGDAGADLVAREDVLLPAGGGRAVVGTGVAVAIPAGHAGLVLPRSGLAVSHGVTVVNAPGLVDAGYRGELRVALLNTDPVADYQVRRGDRIAQLVVIAVAQVAMTVVDELADSERGHGGFGHSGR
jgi:dUTP pyrophosphatase